LIGGLREAVQQKHQLARLRPRGPRVELELTHCEPKGRDLLEGFTGAAERIPIRHPAVQRRRIVADVRARAHVAHRHSAHLARAERDEQRQRGGRA
jgi:hypothetical protein